MTSAVAYLVRVARKAMLVTGSRALTMSPVADVWARDELRLRIDMLPDDAVLVTGDAAGPDEWASAIAAARGLVVCVYDKFGTRLTWRSEGRRVIVIESRPWATGLRPETGEEWKAWLLRRDRVMVEEVAAAHHAGKIEAGVVALFAPWARTQGTAYTLRHAKNADLPWKRVVCPDQFGPGATRAAP